MSTKEIKWSPSHFPRGTVIKTCLFKLDEKGNLISYYGLDQSHPVEFVVDHVITSTTWGGRITYVVTTTKKDNPLYDGDDLIMFNTDHVIGIKSLGKQLVIKHVQYKAAYWDYYEFNTGKPTSNATPTIASYYLKFVIMHFAQRINQTKEFNFSKMIDSLIKCGVFKRINDYDYTFNKKKMKRWLKQNLNRYIITEKELAKIRDQVDAEFYSAMDNDFDRGYDGNQSDAGTDVPEPLTLKREKGPFSSNVNFNQPFIEDEEPPFEEYEKMSPEEKARHDGLYGGCTEADFA